MGAEQGRTAFISGVGPDSNLNCSMRRVWLLLSMVLLAGVSAVSAQPSGKIAGKLIDATTGEPLPGATVIVEGTTLGAASGVTGDYTILNVAPGTHTLIASMVGYATTRVENVEVSIDRTTRIDFEMREEIIEGEEVVVEARRPLVERDRTTSASYVSSETIDNLPVQEVGDLLQLQSGVAYDAAGRLHMRGGRSGEVAYMVDGIPVTDQFRGGSKIEIENSWIQELQVISGTFNAEYGQAQSGVINIVTKEGDVQNYSGSASAFLGSYLTTRDDIFMNMGDVRADQYNGEFSLSGPLKFLPESSFFVDARYFKSDGYLYGQRRARIEDTVPIQAYVREAQTQASDRETLVGIHIPDSLMTGDRAYVPMNPNEKVSLHGSLSFRPFKNVRLNYSAFLTDESRRSYSDSRRYAPDGQPTTVDRGANHILSLTHMLTPTTFYRVGLSYQVSNVETRLFEDYLDPRFQGPAYSANGFNFGGTSNAHTWSNQKTALGKIDLTSQVGRFNLIKGGIEAQLHRVENFRMTTIADGPVYLPANLRLPARNTAGNDHYVQRPFELAAYVQDKIEIDEIIVNAGVRFDYWNPNAYLPEDLEATTDPMDGIRLTSPLIKSDPSMQVSPRVGIAFPISQDGVLHVSYGHFFQVPRFNYIFTNSEFEVELGDLETIMGNPNLKPERTVAYEIGLQQGLTRDWKVEMTVYYKDIKNLLGQEIINTRDTKIYARYINRDYGNTKGFVFSLIKQYADGFAATVDYTYQVARGNASDPNSVFYNNQTQPPIEPEKQVLPLDWDQRHAINGTVIMGDPSNRSLSLIGRFTTGQPYTPSNPGSQLTRQLANSERRPARLNIDVSFQQRLTIAGQRVRLFARGYNVLDALNPKSVYTSTGNPHHPYRTLGEAEVVRQNPNFSMEEIDLRPDFFAPPRRVIVGIDVSF